MMTPTKARWIFKLACLVSPDDKDKAAAALTPIVEMLEMPERVFCQETLVPVSIAKRRTVIPALNDIQAALQVWLKENPDPQPAIMDKRMEHWDAWDHRWHAYYAARLQEGFKPLGRPHLMSLLRVEAPRVAQYLDGPTGSPRSTTKVVHSTSPQQQRNWIDHDD